MSTESDKVKDTPSITKKTIFFFQNIIRSKAATKAKQHPINGRRKYNSFSIGKYLESLDTLLNHQETYS